MLEPSTDVSPLLVPSDKLVPVAPIETPFSLTDTVAFPVAANLIVLAVAVAEALLLPSEIVVNA